MTIQKIYIALIAVAFGFTSCDDILSDSTVSTTDVVEGLKTALKIGTDSSTTELSQEDGYYANPLMRIPLPKQVDTLRQAMEFMRQISPAAASIIDSKLENLELAINRSAEDAAADAKPIFTDAITNLSISDGWQILNGEVPNDLTKAEGFDSLAATKYLKNQTYGDLLAAFSPKMNTALDKPFVGNESAADMWNAVTANYNGFVSQYGTAARLAATLAGRDDLLFNEVNPNLGELVTGKALDGLFIKVGEQERAIRRNPFQWASDIIRKVFGSITSVAETGTNSTAI